MTGGASRSPEIGVELRKHLIRSISDARSSPLQRHLLRIRTEGLWEDWLAFFLEGIAVTAGEAADTAERVLQLFAIDKEKIQTLGRATHSALRLHGFMQTSPYFRIRTAVKSLKLTMPTITNAVSHLTRLGIVKEISGKHRDHLFAYSRYVNIALEGTEPLSNR